MRVISTDWILDNITFNITNFSNLAALIVIISLARDAVSFFFVAFSKFQSLNFSYLDKKNVYGLPCAYELECREYAGLHCLNNTCLWATPFVISKAIYKNIFLIIFLSFKAAIQPFTGTTPNAVRKHIPFKFRYHINLHFLKT